MTFEGECARERHLLNVMVSARFSAPLACLIDGAEIPKLVFDDCSEGYVYTGKWNERQGTSKYYTTLYTHITLLLNIE